MAGTRVAMGIVMGDTAEDTVAGMVMVGMADMEEDMVVLW